MSTTAKGQQDYYLACKAALAFAEVDHPELVERVRAAQHDVHNAESNRGRNPGRSADLRLMNARVARKVAQTELSTAVRAADSSASNQPANHVPEGSDGP